MPTKKKLMETESTAAAPEEPHYISTAPEPTALYAYADFEIKKLNIKVAAGEVFTPPHGWERDLDAEETLKTEKLKQGASVRVGMIFNYLGEVVNPGEKNPDLRERRTHTAVLPLEVR